MLLHPLIDALFNLESCEPSKQLTAVRERLRAASDRPSILLVLPPAELLATVDRPTLFKDHYLLSHVFDAAHLRGNRIAALNGSDWLLAIAKNEVTPADGFPGHQPRPALITNRFLWSPGFATLAVDATFLVLELDSLLLTGDALHRASWFGGGKSTPKDGPDPAPAGPADAGSVATASNVVNRVANRAPAARIAAPTTDAVPRPYAQRPQNPASGLGRTAAQREQNMAKVDYLLACLQGDVASSHELAQRFHHAVASVVKTLVAAGAAVVGDEAAAGDGAAVSVAGVYRYAEYRLSRHLLARLDRLLDGELAGARFRDLHGRLRALDLGQVDIPGVAHLDVAAFERAVAEAAAALAGLGQARHAHDMCQVFLRALKILADPRLGTVSADTLLGLFMLTVLRTSEACAGVLERDLYFVLRFSFQTSDAAPPHASAGRLSYTLMVVESVLLQLRMEYPRLRQLADANTALWDAVRRADLAAVRAVARHCPSAMASRHHGRSVLFMAIADGNLAMLRFLLREFPDVYTPDFVLRDRDIHSRTLLMAAVQQDLALATALLDHLGPGPADCPELRQYFRAVDLSHRGIAFYLHDPRDLGPQYLALIDFTTKDGDGLTPILYHARNNNAAPFLPCVANFFDHIDPAEDSLLHLTADDPAAVRTLVALPSCDVNWTNRTGKPALQTAQSNAPVVDLLLQHGADPWIPFYMDDLATIGKMVASVRDFPYVVRTSRTDQQFDVFTLVDGKPTATRHSYQCFQRLEEQLSQRYPTSWIPPLPSIKAEYSPSEELFAMFSHLLVSQENIRLSMWLGVLAGHATVKDAAELHRFLHQSSPHDTAVEVAPSPIPDKTDDQELLGPAEQVSIMAFLQLALDHLRTVRSAIGDLIRILARMDTLKLELSMCQTKVERNLANHLAPLYDCALRVVRCELTDHLQGSQIPRIVRIAYGQLITYARNLEARLQDPARFAAELETQKARYEENRAKLKQLAESGSKSLWFSENKRLAEINGLEELVSTGRSRIKRLEKSIIETHHSLAGELSAFNKTHEKELLGQLEHYSRNQLQEAKDGLRRLQHGYAISHREAAQ